MINRISQLKLLVSVLYFFFWLPQVDDFRTFLADFVLSLPQVDRVEAAAD